MKQVLGTLPACLDDKPPQWLLQRPVKAQQAGASAIFL